MREKVENILGYKIPKDLDWILQRSIIAGKTAEEIAKLIIAAR
jgi:hypothetical protein